MGTGQEDESTFRVCVDRSEALITPVSGGSRERIHLQYHAADAINPPTDPLNAPTLPLRFDEDR